MTKNQIIETFNGFTCLTKCPFSDECNKMQFKIRMHTTDVFTLCDVIRGNIPLED